jgi:hypothetical protein
MATHKSKPTAAIRRNARMEREALLRLANLESLETIEPEEIDYNNFPYPWEDSEMEDNKNYFH